MSEQYAYMCDLKRLWMQLWFPFPLSRYPSYIKLSLGSLCAGNALGDGEDGLFVIFNCILSTGASLVLSSCSQLFTSRPSSFSLTSETYLLFPQFGNRESTHGTQKINGITESYMLKTRNRKPRSRLHGLRFDKSEKSMHQSRGNPSFLPFEIDKPIHPTWKVAKEEGQSCWCTMSRLDQFGLLWERTSRSRSVELCDWHEFVIL